MKDSSCGIHKYYVQILKYKNTFSDLEALQYKE